MAKKKFELKMTPLESHCGDLMTIEDFVSDVNSKCLIDYDGFGYYSDGKEVSNIIVYPSEVEKKGVVSNSWSHVMWFNR